MQTVIETKTYLIHAKQAGVSDDERQGIVDTLAADPDAGELMSGTGGARKLRFAKQGAGKSGGYRIVTYYGSEDVPVFLLDIYAKGQKINLTAAEKKELAGLLSQIAETYRSSTRAVVRREGSRER